MASELRAGKTDTRPIIRRQSMPEFVRVRLRTLLWVRWFTIAGQTAAILIVEQAFGLEVPTLECLLVIAVGIPVNLFLRFYFPGRRLSHRELAISLAFDIVQLAALLYLTGGMQNPFAFLIVAPVIMAAATLPNAYLLALGTLALAFTHLLAPFHLPLPWYPGETFRIEDLIVYGHAISLSVCLVFFAFIVNRIASEARALSDALTATEVALMNEQHLNALDGLAAAAAHELGSPLGTIVVIAKELEHFAPADDPNSDDYKLLRSQAERCREILRKIRQLPSEGEAQMSNRPLMGLLEEVIEPHRHFGVDIFVNVAETGADISEPIFPRHPGILYGLGNLVENAVDFAESKVVITVSWTAEIIEVRIQDDGPGFANQVVDRLGEPYVTTRDHNHQEKAAGLGLGLFISRTLLERSGAQFEIERSNTPWSTGACIRLEWQASTLKLN